MNTASDTPISLATPPEGYADWLGDLKARIHAAQQRATLSVNRELVLLYWQIGRDILTRQAHDLRGAFPEMKGFSPRNLKYMRAFSEAWSDSEFVQQAAAQLPWFHLCTLMDKLKTRIERDWYLAKAIEHNWSRNILVMQIETRLLERNGQAVTNFAVTSPKPQSDLAIDLLFYHLKLRCYVVIELKGGKFKPAHWGQLGFYLTAMDRQVKNEHDNPTIGLLLCKSKNKIVAEYALGDKSQSMGVAEYKLLESLPTELQTSLPTIEQIERELSGSDLVIDDTAEE